jgi:hypothetical protein
MILSIIISLLFVLIVLPVGADGEAHLPVSIVDGKWSNPSPVAVTNHRCFKMDNTEPAVDENKISAGIVSGKTYCYTDTNPGPGFDEGSGFGFNGAIDSPTDIPPGTPFLLGVLTHYNRHVAATANTFLNGAQLDVIMDVAGGAVPPSITFSWDIMLDETSNDPSLNAGRICPYPAGSFYSPAYLDFNGGFNSYTETYGTVYRHANVGGSPPLTQRDLQQWLCGDGITAAPSGPTSQVFSIGGKRYTLQLQGISYPSRRVSNMSTQEVAAECGDGPSQETPSLLLETRELTDTDACIWAIFTTPTAVTMAESLHVEPTTAFPEGHLTVVMAMVGLIWLLFLLWRVQASRT